MKTDLLRRGLAVLLLSTAVYAAVRTERILAFFDPRPPPAAADPASGGATIQGVDVTLEAKDRAEVARTIETWIGELGLAEEVRGRWSCRDGIGARDCTVRSNGGLLAVTCNVGVGCWIQCAAVHW